MRICNLAWVASSDAGAPPRPALISAAESDPVLMRALISLVLLLGADAPVPITDKYTLVTDAKGDSGPCRGGSWKTQTTTTTPTTR